MGCNCGGRGRTTRATSSQGGYWRHTDQYGGVVPYQSERTARIALSRTKGRLERVDSRGTVIETIPYSQESRRGG